MSAVSKHKNSFYQQLPRLYSCIYVDIPMPLNTFVVVFLFLIPYHGSGGRRASRIMAFCRGGSLRGLLMHRMLLEKRV